MVLVVSGWSYVSRSDEPGSLLTDLKSEGNVEAQRVYTHPDANAVLKLVLTDWMTNPEVKKISRGYLISSDAETDNKREPAPERILIDERVVPKEFDLEIPGVAVELCDRSQRDLRNGETYVRIDRFVPRKDGSIYIEFFHAGVGSIGGAWARYEATKTDGKWEVELAMTARLTPEPGKAEPGVEASSR